MKPVATVVLAAAALWCGAAYADACEDLMPRSLATTLSRSYPGFRAPLEYDNAPEDIERDKARGGTGCLGIGTGDFTGDGKKDYVVALTSLKGNAGLAVIALPQKGGWRLARLHSWSAHTRSSAYVMTLAPPAAGTAGDCSNWSVRIGSVDGGASVYCYRRGAWQRIASER